MGKPAIIVIAVLVLALIGYLGYSRMQPGGTNMMNQAGEQNGGSMTRGSIKSLLGGSKNVTCTIAASENAGEGTIYVAGAKMRGDFSTQVEGKNMNSHMIQDGEYAYMWSDEDSRGTKMKLDFDQPAPSVSAGSSTPTQTEDLDKEVDMNCSGWLPDNSKFNVPGDVEFTDLSEILENSMMQNKTGTSVPKVDPSVCNQIEDAAAKAQCLKALGN